MGDTAYRSPASSSCGHHFQTRTRTTLLYSCMKSTTQTLEPRALSPATAQSIEPDETTHGTKVPKEHQENQGKNSAAVEHEILELQSQRHSATRTDPRIRNICGCGQACAVHLPADTSSLYHCSNRGCKYDTCHFLPQRSSIHLPRLTQRLVTLFNYSL
jgi:hypothetical protein